MIQKLTAQILVVTGALKTIAKDALALCIPLSIILILLDVFLGTDFKIIDKAAVVLGLTKNNILLTAVIAYIVVIWSKK